ncbi:MAG: hypothetical protein LUG83_08615, partial [Lachnospiraceae bacterium]|nr:hypothetical protein [Lachnospiraceae bacterium]
MKKLREKMISVVMLSTISVFALTWIIVCLLLVTYNTRQADGMTQIISVYNGEVPRIQEFKEDSFEDIYNTINFFNEESAFRTRYFVVSLNEDMQAQMADTEHIASIDEETACDMAEEAAAKGNTVGYIGKFRYRITTDNTDACIVIFVDCSESFSSQHVTAIILATISVIFTILVT